MLHVRFLRFSRQFSKLFLRKRSSSRSQLKHFIGHIICVTVCLCGMCLCATLTWRRYAKIYKRRQTKMSYHTESDLGLLLYFYCATCARSTTRRRNSAIQSYFSCQTDQTDRRNWTNLVCLWFCNSISKPEIIHNAQSCILSETNLIERFCCWLKVVQLLNNYWK